MDWVVEIWDLETGAATKVVTERRVNLRPALPDVCAGCALFACWSALDCDLHWLQRGFEHVVTAFLVLGNLCYDLILFSLSHHGLPLSTKRRNIALRSN